MGDYTHIADELLEDSDEFEESDLYKVREAVKSWQIENLRWGECL